MLANAINVCKNITREVELRKEFVASQIYSNYLYNINTHLTLRVLRAEERLILSQLLKTQNAIKWHPKLTVFMFKFFYLKISPSEVFSVCFIQHYNFRML